MGGDRFVRWLCPRYPSRSDGGCWTPCSNPCYSGLEHNLYWNRALLCGKGKDLFLQSVLSFHWEIPESVRALNDLQKFQMLRHLLQQTTWVDILRKQLSGIFHRTGMTILWSALDWLCQIGWHGGIHAHRGVPANCRWALVVGLYKVRFYEEPRIHFR